MKFVFQKIKKRSTHCFTKIIVNLFCPLDKSLKCWWTNNVCVMFNLAIKVLSRNIYSKIFNIFLFLFQYMPWSIGFHMPRSHYYRIGHLSRFQRAICPGFGTGIRPPGQKPWRLLSRVVEPGQNVPRAKKSLRPAGLEPKTYCLAHGLLANSPK